MTVCNMSIEAGAKAGMIAPDETTFDYLEGRAHAPAGRAWDEAVAHWRTLATDPDATFDKEVRLDAAEIDPHVSWGTNPGQVVPITGAVPRPDDFADPVERHAAERALEYMGLDRRHADERGPRRHRVHRLVHQRPHRGPAGRGRGGRGPPGRLRAAHPGRARARGRSRPRPRPRASTGCFVDAGFDWRDPGCSMCLAMNPDKLAPGERCASTSNRNFEGRQGRGGRTHLVSPAVAAATAIAGHFATPDDL